MSLNSIKRDLKDYIEENKARLEAWENVTYLTKKDGTPFKSMSKNFTNATYKGKNLFEDTFLKLIQNLPKINILEIILIVVIRIIQILWKKLSKKYQKKSKAQKGLSNH
mgnify:CR=1 FL=1